MKRTKLFCLVFTAALLLANSSAANAQNGRVRKFVVSFDKFGSVKIGMTLAEAAKALGVRVVRDDGYEGSECYYASPAGKFKNVAFMMSGRRIVRIDVNGKEFATDRGAKNGDTEARIKRLYKGQYKISQHEYIDVGHYIEVKKKGGKYSIVFETDGNRVTSFRAGRLPQVGYIEGCS